jgi:Protein of unknown function (DUF2283)
VRIEIDPAADAAAIEWAPRARGESQVVGRPGARGVRLYFDAAGDVVGLEVLGWSRRAETPREVRVVVHAERAREALPGAHPLARAMSEGPAVATDDRHRPLHEGRPMLTLAEAAARVGRERSWVSREMTAGRLRALKIGRSWWTAREWVDEYERARRGGPGAAGEPRRPPAGRRAAGGRHPSGSTGRAASQRA